MFTGIISEIGTVREVRNVGEGICFSIDGPRSIGGARIGDSIAVNGACLTIVLIAGMTFSVEVVEETLSKTTLRELRPGKRVNLESPLRLGDQLGGHIVQGHVDGVATVRSFSPRSSSWIVEVELPENLVRYVIPVGSIAIDGISLTVASIAGNCMMVSIIPHTMDNTTIHEFEPGTRVNVECDPIGKYVENLMVRGKGPADGRINHDLLKQWGYEP